MTFLEQQIKKLKSKSLELDKVVVTEASVKESEEPLFNVHKCFLPVPIGQTEGIPIMWNITKREFEEIKKNRNDCDLHKELKGQCQTKVTKDEIWIYYDLIPVNATASERSVYYNPKNFVKADVDEKVDVITLDKWID